MKKVRRVCESCFGVDKEIDVLRSIEGVRLCGECAHLYFVWRQEESLLTPAVHVFLSAVQHGLWLPIGDVPLMRLATRIMQRAAQRRRKSNLVDATKRVLTRFANRKKAICT